MVNCSPIKWLIVPFFLYVVNRSSTWHLFTVVASFGTKLHFIVPSLFTKIGPFLRRSEYKFRETTRERCDLFIQLLTTARVTRIYTISDKNKEDISRCVADYPSPLFNVAKRTAFFQEPDIFYAINIVTGEEGSNMLWCHDLFDRDCRVKVMQCEKDL